MGLPGRQLLAHLAVGQGPPSTGGARPLLFLARPKQMTSAPDYLNPNVPAGLKRAVMPVVEATAASLEGMGASSILPIHFALKSCAGPLKGPVDPDSGDE